MCHLVNNGELKNNSDKMTKVIQIYNALNSELVQYIIFHTFLIVDESMVPYYGRHSYMMSIRGKPICFCCNLWCLCGENGCPYQLSIYTGKSGNSIVPLGTCVVQGIVDVVKEH